MIQYVVHYLAGALSLILSIITVALGQGVIASSNLDAFNRQPKAIDSIKKSTILALALTETTTLLGLITSLFLIFKPVGNLYISLAEMGMVIAVGLPSLVLGYMTSFTAKHAFSSMARQPFSDKQIGRFMIFSQSLMQTPLVLGFIVALLIYFQLNYIETLGQSLTFIASGIAIGLGSIGSAYGSGIFTGQACKSLGLNKNIYSKMVSFTIISQVIIETPVILAMLISFLLLRLAVTPITTIQGIIYLAASLTIGMGAIGSGIGSGLTASKACNQIALNSSQYNFISRLTIFAQSIIDTSAIYAFIIALFFILLPI